MMHYLIRILALLVFAGALGDVWSTEKAISAGAVEANPLESWIMRLLGPKWVIPRLLFGLFDIWIVMKNPVARETWLGAASFGLNVALMAFVIWNNIKVAAAQAK